MAESGRELEVKAALQDAPALDRVAGAVRAGPPVRQENVFFDGDDRRLGRSGHALRLRLERFDSAHAGPARATLTLKGPDTGSGGVAIRTEVGAPVAPETAEALARGEGRIESLPLPPSVESLRLARGAPLRPWLRFTNVRRTATVRIAGADCEVACDETTFPDGSVEREVEVEAPDEATVAAAREWLRGLLARLGLPWRPQREGKLTRAAHRGAGAAPD